MQHLVQDLSAALDSDLQGIDWMGVDTRKQAREKLAAFLDKIGVSVQGLGGGRLTFSP